VLTDAPFGPAWDDDQESSGRRVPLRKGAVLARRLVRPLATEMDESRQHDDGPTHPGVRCRDEADAEATSIAASLPLVARAAALEPGATGWRRFRGSGMSARAASSGLAAALSSSVRFADAPGRIKVA
jgi:hypothetical protein